MFSRPPKTAPFHGGRPAGSPSSWRLTAAVALVLAARGACLAGTVHFDGSFGSNASLAGPNFLIPAESGKQVGGNLFHSFSQFNLVNGESATFLAPQNGSSVSNILARVTGGSQSSIDGLLRSDIPGANLYLVNPQGFLFGAHAQLDISGSFTATSASSLKLADGAHFDAAPGAADLTLSAAPVSAFGFLKAPGDINVMGNLAVPTGQQLTLAGGNLLIAQGSLTAPSGKVSLLSAKSEGTVDTKLHGKVKKGNITVLESTVDVSGPKGGSIVIRGGALTVDRSAIVSETTAAGAGGSIDIAVSGSTVVTRQSRIFTLTNTSGSAGLVSLRSGSLNITSNSLVGSQALSTASATARAGRVNVTAGSLSISNESAISASTFGLGRGNLVSVSAQNISLSGDSSDTATGIFSNSEGTRSGGGGGGIQVFAAQKLTIESGASISADTKGFARGGDVSVTAGSIYTASFGQTAKTGIFADTLGSGPGGDVHVQALKVTIVDGGLISTKTLGSGAGGDTLVNARKLVIDRGDSTLFTGIAADSPVASGPGGDVHIAVDSIDILDGGQISANTSNNGAGGSVDVQAHTISLSGKLALISADSVSTGAGGPGGNVSVKADQLSILDGARVSAATFGQGAGGDVNVTATKAFFSSADPNVFTGITTVSKPLPSVPGGAAGSVHVNIGDLTLTGGGGIAGDTFGSGAGGSVSVISHSITLENGATIAADTAGSGLSGNVSVTAHDILISGKEQAVRTGIFSDSLLPELGGDSGGAGGKVEVQAHDIRLRSLGEIGATSVTGGDGGSVAVQADNLVLESAATIVASAGGTGKAGSVDISVQRPFELTSGANISSTSVLSDAGTISIASASDINLTDGSVTVEATAGNAGQIVLSTNHQLHLVNSQLLAAAGQNGGDIAINSDFVLLDHSLISANAVGRGGDITLAALYFFTSQSTITATGSQAGTINIQAPELNLANGLVTLPSSVLDASAQIREQCARRLGLDFSSFLLVGRGGTAQAPDEDQPILGVAPAAPPAKKPAPAPPKKGRSQSSG